MDPGEDGFRARLRTVLTGAPDTPLTLIGNFEVEQRWGSDETGLLRFGGPAGGSAASRLDELALLLAGERDVVLLKERPDPGFLEHLAELGLGVPRILVPAASDPRNTVTADVLGDPEVLAELVRLAALGYRIAPHGISDQEAELSRLTGQAVAGPAVEVCKRVNSKVYSRDIATELGLPQPEGRACRTMAELDAAFAWGREMVARGRRVVVKDAFGVSGKGLLVVTDVRRFEQLRRLIGTAAARAGHDRVALVVEEWIARRTDLNYQFTVDRGGAARLDFVKEALTENGVHRGHRFPVALSEAHGCLLAHTVDALAGRLSSDGYFGVVGVDAMVGEDGELYPVVEINARNNMSTYQAVLHEVLGLESGQRVALARHFAVPPGVGADFSAMRALLGSLLLRPGGGSGLAVTAFATAVSPTVDAAGRLYGLLVAVSTAELDSLEQRVAERLLVPIPEGASR